MHPAVLSQLRKRGEQLLLVGAEVRAAAATWHELMQGTAGAHVSLHTLCTLEGQQSERQKLAECTHARVLHSHSTALRLCGFAGAQHGPAGGAAAAAGPGAAADRPGLPGKWEIQFMQLLACRSQAETC